MASHASFTAANSTAVNSTFTRVNLDGSAVRYQDRTGSSSLAWKTVSTDSRPPVPGNSAKVYKQSVKFIMPITADQTINGVTVPTLVRSYEFDGVIKIPADGTQLERDDFAALVSNILASATIKDLTAKLLPLNGP